MSYISDNVRDAALNHIATETTVLHACKQQPTSFADVAVQTLGTKTPPTISNPTNGAISGRRVTVQAINDGVVNTSGDATHWALVSGDDLLASDALDVVVPVVSGESFSIGAFDIEFPDQ